MAKRKNKNGYNKNNVLFFSFITLFISLFLSIGYSSYSKSLLINKSSAVIRVDENVRIISVSVDSTAGGGSTTNVDYGVSSIASNITLPNSTSSVTYSVTVKNYGSYEVGIKSISLPDSLKNVLDINLDGYVLGTKLRDSAKTCDNSATGCKLSLESTFKVIVNYKSGYYDSNNVTFNNFKLDFVFEEAFDIKYSGFLNLPSNMPDSILKGATFSYDVGSRGEIVLLKNGSQSTEFTVSNNVVTVSNVNTDIQLNNYYSVNISVSPTDVSIIRYSINDGDIDEVKGNLSIKVLGGTKLKVDALVSNKYDTWTETFASISADVKREITLNKIYYTYLVKSSPSANILLEYNNTSTLCSDKTSCSVTLEPDTEVKYTVSKDYYNTKNNNFEKITKNLSYDVTLTEKTKKDFRVNSTSYTKKGGTFTTADDAIRGDGVNSSSFAKCIDKDATITWSWSLSSTIPEGARIDSFSYAFKIDATASPSVLAIFSAGGAERARASFTYGGSGGTVYTYSNGQTGGCLPTSAQLRSGATLSVNMNKTLAIKMWYGATLSGKYTPK